MKGGLTLTMRASRSASPGGTETCWSMKCATPASRAPGTNASPSASRVSASSPLSRRNGTARARASPGVIRTSNPATEKVSMPMLAPLRKTRRSMASMDSSLTETTHRASFCLNGVNDNGRDESSARRGDPWVKLMAATHPRIDAVAWRALQALAADATLAAEFDNKDRGNGRAGRLEETMRIVSGLFAALVVLFAAQTASAQSGYPN